MTDTIESTTACSWCLKIHVGPRDRECAGVPPDPAREARLSSPFTIREESPGIFRVYVFSCGLYQPGSREDAERLLRSLEHDRAEHNRRVDEEIVRLRELLERGVHLLDASPPAELVLKLHEAACYALSEFGDEYEGRLGQLHEAVDALDAWKAGRCEGSK